ncbi:MtrAB system accessory lipoprotein LpqB [Rhodococcus kronopolitis]|uniref:Lipoprotein LpqB n=1 Tax=Rhodococcus kronopolitis TaxID=1460226 RepID=A0ABV9FKG7_9NOCA
MTGRWHRGRRRVALAAAGLATAVLAGGCASLPESSSPMAIGTITRDPVTVSVPVPEPGREPDSMLRDFFAASTDPTDAHLAARQFLTPAAAERWDDAASTTVVDKVDVLQESRTGDEASYAVRANRVGQLDDGGQYQTAEGTFEAKFRMTRVGGEWRIDDLPPGVIMDRPQFLKTYKREALYFLDPTGNTVVPDLRWVSATAEEMPGRLVDLLIAGPKPGLSGAVRNVAGNLSVPGPITKADGRNVGVGVGFGGVRIDFLGAEELSPEDRALLASQVVWTLAAAEISGPYVLTLNGRPLDDRHVDGWSTADVSTTDPRVAANSSVGLHALAGGSLVAVTDTGVSAVPGYFGSASVLRSIALSRDGKLAAAVAATGRSAPEQGNVLMIGPTDGTGTPALEAGSLTRPTWSSFEPTAWTVADGVRVVRVTLDGSGQPVVSPVDTRALAPLGETMTELRLSSDGARAAVIVDGKVYVVSVVQGEDGTYALTSPRPVATGLGSPALSLDWSSGDTIVVARAASEIPVVSVSVDGSRMDALPSRNLSPPVSSVDASANSAFVADSRAVFQLNNNDPAGDRYWREVPALAGVKAIPVLPG